MEWVYAGQAGNLDRRLKEHYRGTSDQSRCIHRHKGRRSQMRSTP